MSNYGRKNIKEETISEAINMVLDGYSHRLVSEKYRISKGLIGKWMKKAGETQPSTTKYKKQSLHKNPVLQDWDKVRVTIRRATEVEESITDALQPLLNIAEGKADIESWNDRVMELLLAVDVQIEKQRHVIFTAIDNYDPELLQQIKKDLALVEQ